MSGGIVGLLSSRAHSTAASLQQPAPRVCLGVGIVRAIDAASGRLFILTDVQAEDLEAVDVLKVIAILPVAGQTENVLMGKLQLQSWSLRA